MKNVSADGLDFLRLQNLKWNFSLFESGDQVAVTPLLKADLEGIKIGIEQCLDCPATFDDEGLHA
jgi:hypothetical protein